MKRRDFWKMLAAFGLALALVLTGCDTGTGPDTDTDITLPETTPPDTIPSFNFPAFLASLPVGPVPSGGRWPVWSAGNTISVWEEEPGGERALRASFGGAHGVDILLSGANGIGVREGDTLEIHGRIIVIATGEAPETSSFPNMWPFQLAAIRSALGGDPSTNLASVPITPPSPNFVVQHVIRATDLVPVGWPPGPTLRLVNEPSNPATAMYVTNILVIRQ